MSLTVDLPTSSSLNSGITRPLPPSRSKRHSSFYPSSSVASGSYLGTEIQGVLGGLRERSEEELRAADRDALERAIRSSWAEQDELRGRLSGIESRVKDLEEEKKGYEIVIATSQARYEEALNDQSRLEADLEGRDDLLDRLRKRVNKAERLTRENAKRALEQERSFEAERAALQAQETHLQQRIRSLISTKSTRASSPSNREHTSQSLSDLQEELASLKISHSTLLAQLNTLTKKVHKLRSSNKALAEENEGWEFLVRDRTLKGKFREGGLLGVREDVELEQRAEERSQLEVLDEELEMDELNSDLDAQSPILEDGAGFIQDLDEQPESVMLPTSPDSVHLKPPMSRRKSNKNDIGHAEQSQSGALNLAKELDRVETDKLAEKSSPREVGNENLQAELKSLREENKALTLYCSKIIDRIIAQEGFEHILSIDYKTRRIGSRSASASSRQNLKDITTTMQAASQPPQEAVPVEVKDEKKARPLSTMIRAMSGTAEKSPVVPDPPTEVKAEEKEKEHKVTKRARRGFSLDFRSLGFGGSSSSTTPTETKPPLSLKPLTLSSRTTTPTISNKPALGRRLEKEEEDEEDRRERHRLEATLKLMGVEKGHHPSFSNSAAKTVSTSWKLTKVQPKIQEAADKQERESLIQSSSYNSQQDQPRSTPLSRLSSAIGSNDSPPPPLSPDFSGGDKSLSPELVAEAALRAFDQREAEQVKALSKGKSGERYTSPSPSSSGFRRPSGRRVASLDSTYAAGEVSATKGPGESDRQSGEQKARASGSISTLWSMGSSRPNSQEISGQQG